MKITILAVGKIKEKYLTQGIQAYHKRINSYAKLKIEEVKDEPLPSKLHRAEIDKVLEEEGKKIDAKINRPAHLISLDPQGVQFTSEAFSSHIEALLTRGTSQFTFVIGGTLGLAPWLKEKSDLVLSFSKFTFPHQLMRLILIEQIYRACKIMWREPYHY